MGPGPSTQGVYSGTLTEKEKEKMKEHANQDTNYPEMTKDLMQR